MTPHRADGAALPLVAGTRTTSLRLRVTLATLVLLTVALVAVGVAVDVVLGAQLRADIRQRLFDRAGYAQLSAEQGLDPQALADRLTGDGVVASYRVNGVTYYGRSRPAAPARGVAGAAKPPPKRHAPKPAGAVVRQSGDQITVTQALAGGVLSLNTSQAGAEQALGRLRRIEIIAGALTVALTGLLLTRVVAVALRPLTRLTTLAVGIAGAAGAGGSDPAIHRTELGRAASAFDEMLAALEAAERDARSAAAAANAAEDRMRQLLADVSHELRTPVAGLQASAETLLRENPDRTDREQLAVGMVRETHRAARLVDDLMLVTRLEHAPPGLPPRLNQPVDLAQLAVDVGVDQGRLAAELELTVRADRQLWVDGDAERLTQILTNLVANARHATPPGGRVTVLAHRSGATARIEVIDTGPGVPAADRERVFDRFVRLDPARSRRHGGSGLGLSIARALARAHGGTVVCADNAHGARFVLTLPVRPGV